VGGREPNLAGEMTTVPQVMKLKKGAVKKPPEEGEKEQRLRSKGRKGEDDDAVNGPLKGDVRRLSSGRGKAAPSWEKSVSESGEGNS